MKKLTWHINRLTKMLPAEIAYRFQHKFREKYDEWTLIRNPLLIPVADDLSLSALFSLSDHVSHEYFSDWFAESEFTYLQRQADRYLKNRVTVFGREYDFGRKIDWHLEPKAGKQWPKKFWTEIDIRNGFTHGAPKFVWETNRLYGLPLLGLAFRFTREKKYADKIFQLVGEWLEANPYPYGVNWASGIELAVRIANLIWALSFLREYELNKQNRENLNNFFHTHARHLFRYPSKFSSNNNHAIAEAFGLFLVGIFFPRYEKASQWLNFGKTVLERECLRQILPDGGSYEYSTTYLSFVLDFFLMFKIVCDSQDIKYNREINSRLEKSCEYIHLIMDSKGNVPNIGDQDSAVLINFGMDNHNNLQSILNTGSVLFDNTDFQRDNFPDFKTWALLGDKINKRHVRIKPNPNQSTLLADSGLTVIKQRMKNKEVVFIGNTTPLGMPPLYAHGHLDALSFYLSISGKEILIDPGTYLYHSGGKLRRYFRSTAAHNTVRINEQELTEQVADFMFGKPYKITEHSLKENKKEIIWQAAHDAYRALDNSVIHDRQVVFDLSTETLKLKDSLAGNDNYLIEQFFHFHPQCNVEFNEKQAFIQYDEVMLNIVFDPEVKLTAYRGSEDPLLGWFSARFNHIEPCWTLVARAKGNKKSELSTEIIL